MYMDAPSKVHPKQFPECIKIEIDSHLDSVMQVVSSAPDGEWIVASEEPVRDFSVEFRKRVFEQVVQLRIDTAADQHRSQA